jgi:CRP/FNR family cyclic AMP-dependent transcriptional regulator
MSPSLCRLAERGELRRFHKNTVFIHEGDHGGDLYIILKGRVRAFSSDGAEREVIFGDYGPGEYMGEMSLDGGRRSASVMTLEPTSMAVISRAALADHIAESPEFAFELLSKVIHRARSVTLSVRVLALNDTYGRLRLFLSDPRVEFVSPVPGATGALRTYRLTHKELASRIGCSREMVSRLLKDLEKGGHVAQQRGCIDVLSELPPRW